MRKIWLLLVILLTISVSAQTTNTLSEITVDVHRLSLEFDYSSSSQTITITQAILEGRGATTFSEKTIIPSGSNNIYRLDLPFLLDGTYNLRVTSSDPIGNLRTDIQPIVIDAGTDLLELVEPVSGIGQTNPFNVEIRSISGDQVKCQWRNNYDPRSPPAGNIIQNTFEDSVTFSVSDSGNPTILLDSTDVSVDEINPATDSTTATYGKQKRVYFICDIGSEADYITVQQAFDLGYDTTQTRLNVRAIPSKITDPDNFRQQLIVTTSDRSSCTYSFDGQSDLEFDQGIPQNYDEYKKEYRVTIDRQPTRNSPSEDVIITCQNIAQFPQVSNTFKSEIELENTIGLNIVSPENNGYASNVNIIATTEVTTNSYGCKYDIGSGLQTFSQRNNRQDENNNQIPGEIFESSLNLAEGDYSLTVRCEHGTINPQTKTISFSVDKTNPTKPTINIGNRVCSERFIAEVESTDANFDKIEFEILYDGGPNDGDTVIGPKRASSISGNTNKYEINENLDEGSYTINLVAYDEAGNTNSHTASFTKLSGDSVECDNRGPRTDAYVTNAYQPTAPTCDKVEVEIICNDNYEDGKAFSGCTNSYKRSIVEIDENCPTTFSGSSYSYSDKISLNADSKICWEVKDANNNPTTSELEITITETPSHCCDGNINADEESTDCGGLDCQACDYCMETDGTILKTCAEGMFCSPNTRFCEDASCSDGFKNGDEEAIDCGGSCGNPCITVYSPNSLPTENDVVVQGNEQNFDLVIESIEGADCKYRIGKNSIAIGGEGVYSFIPLTGTQNTRHQKQDIISSYNENEIVGIHVSCKPDARPNNNNMFYENFDLLYILDSTLMNINRLYVKHLSYELDSPVEIYQSIGSPASINVETNLFGTCVAKKTTDSTWPSYPNTATKNHEIPINLNQISQETDNTAVFEVRCRSIDPSKTSEIATISIKVDPNADNDIEVIQPAYGELQETNSVSLVIKPNRPNAQCSWSKTTPDSKNPNMRVSGDQFVSNGPYSADEGMNYVSFECDIDGYGIARLLNYQFSVDSTKPVITRIDVPEMIEQTSSVAATIYNDDSLADIVKYEFWIEDEQGRVIASDTIEYTDPSAEQNKQVELSGLTLDDLSTYTFWAITTDEFDRESNPKQADNNIFVNENNCESDIDCSPNSYCNSEGTYGYCVPETCTNNQWDNTGKDREEATDCGGLCESCIQLIKPETNFNNFGVSDSQVFPFWIKTIPETSGCKYGRVSATTPLTTTDGLIHKKENFDIGIANTPITIKIDECETTDANSISLNEKEFTLAYYSQAPNIEAELIHHANSGDAIYKNEIPTIFERPLSFSIAIETDQYSKCKYTNIEGQSYSSMQSLDIYSTSQPFKQTHVFSFDVNNNPTNHKYWVQCENALGLTDDTKRVKIEFNTDINAPTSITLENPDKLTADTSPIVEISTNRPVISCDFLKTDGSNYNNPPDMQGASTSFTKQLSGLKEGTYEFLIKCELNEDPFTKEQLISFGIDTTTLEIDEIFDGITFEGLKSASATWTIKNEVNELAKYTTAEYSLLDKNLDEVLNSKGTTTNKFANIEFTNSLEPGTYYWKIRVKDELNRWSSYYISDGFEVTKAPECVIDDDCSGPSEYCQGGECVSETCRDGEYTTGEEAIDCGEVCNKDCIELVQPENAATKVNPLIYQIVTTENTNCKYSYSEISQDNSPAVWPLPGDGTTDHTENVFYLAPAGNTPQNPTYIWNVCNPIRDPITELIQSYGITYDTTPPEIIEAYIVELKNKQNEVLNNPNLIATLYVKTDDETICKYSKTSSSWNNMQSLSSDFNNEHLLETTVVDNTAYEYKILCENKVGDKSTLKTVSFRVDTGENPGITVLNPEKLNNGKFNFNIYVNRKTTNNNDCQYKSSSETNFRPLVKEDEFNWKSSSITISEQGTKTYNFQCQTDIGLIRQDFEFVVDNIGPTPPKISDGDISNSDSQLSATWISEGEYAAVEYYVFELHNKKGKVLGPVETTANSYTANLDFKDGEEYTWKVYGVDVLGQIGTLNNSDGVGIDLPAECTEDQPCRDGFYCENEKCKQDSCRNGQLDRGETAVDCGGACGSCIKFIAPPNDGVTGTSTTTNFDFIVGTTESAECVFKYDRFTNNPLETYVGEFTKSNGDKTHTYNLDFNSGMKRTAYVRCVTEDKGTKLFEDFILEHDDTNPVIEKLYLEGYENDDLPILNTLPLAATIVVETDDETICRYSSTEQNYDSMNPFTNDNYLSESKETLTNLIDENDYTIYVGCANRAQSKTQIKSISFKTNTKQETIIRVHEPRKLSDGKNLMFNISVNRDSVCTYTPENSTAKSLSKNGNYYTSSKFSIANDGEYRFTIDCTPTTANPVSKSHTIEVDTTPPSTPKINDGEDWESTSSLSATFSSDGGIIRVDRYNYTIKDEDGEVILPWSTTKSKNPTIQGLQLSEGKTYYWTVEAIDDIGRRSPKNTSDGVTIVIPSECITDNDCIDKTCEEGKCIEDHCKDGRENQGEEGIDCGEVCRTPCPSCGNGRQEYSEECDLGELNGNPTSGCSDECTYQCDIQPPCPEGLTLCADNTCQLNCNSPECGGPGIPNCNNNGVCDSNEGCSCIDCDGSSVPCKTGSCSIIIPPTGACCDQVGDGTCNEACRQVDPDCGTCGDSIIASNEECDDGNTRNGDGCSSSCTYECGITGNCPEGTSKCNDGTCAIDCLACDVGNPTCDYNGICGPTESCQCSDCDQQKDSCGTGLSCYVDDGACCSDKKDNVCNPNCASVDPDCIESPTCGNGEINYGEECDHGNDNGNRGCTTECKIDCSFAPTSCPEGTYLCGDGTCSINCLSCGKDISSCNNDGVCNNNEGCTCSDCDAQKDSCSGILLCSINDQTCCNTRSDGSCEESCAYVDPDCLSDCETDSDCANDEYCDRGICKEEIKEIIDEDFDNDGMPNDWEEQYGLDPENPLDADEDPDGDGFTNLQEYQNGTNPLIPDIPEETVEEKSNILAWILIILGALMSIGGAVFLYLEKKGMVDVSTESFTSSTPSSILSVIRPKQPEQLKPSETKQAQVFETRSEIKRRKRKDLISEFEDEKPEEVMKEIARGSASSQKNKPESLDDIPVESNKEDVFLELDQLSQKHKDKPRPKPLEKIASNDVFEQLAALSGKTKPAVQRTIEERTKEDVQDILRKIKPSKMDANVFKEIITELMNRGKLDKVHVREVLDEFIETKTLNKEQVEEIKKHFKLK